MLLFYIWHIILIAPELEEKVTKPEQILIGKLIWWLVGGCFEY